MENVVGLLIVLGLYSTALQTSRRKVDTHSSTRFFFLITTYQAFVILIYFENKKCKQYIQIATTVHGPQPLLRSSHRQRYNNTAVKHTLVEPDPRLPAWLDWQLSARPWCCAQRFSGLKAGGLNAVRPFFSFFFFPPAWKFLQLSTRFVRLSYRGNNVN